MKTRNFEFKKLYQAHSASQQSATGLASEHVWSENLFCRGTLVRSGQFLGTVLMAGGLYFLNLWSGDGVRLLVALAAVSALLYLCLAVQSRTRAMVLLNLLAVPILFASACAGLNVGAEWLILSFILHGSVSAVQLSAVDPDLQGGLFCWSVFNGAIALLLLLG